MVYSFEGAFLLEKKSRLRTSDMTTCKKQNAIKAIFYV